MKEGFIYINDNVMPTLLALSHEDQERGLMYVEWPPPIMSFVYAAPQINKFWMKNTPSPLNIVFCCDNRVINICDGKPYCTSVIGSNNYSDLVIELPYGMVSRMKIALGDKVGLIKPSLIEVKGMLNRLL